MLKWYLKEFEVKPQRRWVDEVKKICEVMSMRVGDEWKCVEETVDVNDDEVTFKEVCME